MRNDAGGAPGSPVQDILLELGGRIGAPRDFATGETLFAAGQAVAGLHVIVSGAVRILRPANGRAIVVHRETAGGVLGEVALFGSGFYPGTAVATEPTHTRLLPAAALWRELKSDPALAAVFLRRLAVRAHGIIERLDRQAHQTVLRRLAAHLLERRAASKGRGGSRGAISLGMTQTQLAEELGTVKEVIVRELRTLRRLRLIEPAQRGLYRVTDAAALARLAEP